MAVSAADVKKLRDATGAGMMDCKRALEEADSDFGKALEILRVKGAAKNAKRQDRSASNGLIAAADGCMVELNSGTDFVAKNEEFQSLAADIVAVAAATGSGDTESLSGQKLADGRTVAEMQHRYAYVNTTTGRPETPPDWPAIVDAIREYEPKVAVLDA